MMVKLRMISGPFQATGLNCMCREEPFLDPLKYIDVTRTTETSLDVMLERNIDEYWSVDGVREL